MWAYKDATSSPHTYSMVELKPDTEERFRVRSNILRDPKHVYLLGDPQRIHSALNEKMKHLQSSYGTVSISKNIKKSLPMLIADIVLPKYRKKNC